MVEIINLNKTKKTAAKLAARKVANTIAAKSGRSKEQKNLEAAHLGKTKLGLDEVKKS